MSILTCIRVIVQVSLPDTILLLRNIRTSNSANELHLGKAQAVNAKGHVCQWEKQYML